MQEISLKNVPKGSKVTICRCLALNNADVYRLLEMGLHEGASVEILDKFSHLRALELLVKKSRLCIADDLADKFMVTVDKE